jgi:hypothetical protein
MEIIQEQIKKHNTIEIQNLLKKSRNPVALTYLSKSNNKPVTLPIWTYFYNNKFYCFAGGKSKKVKAIKSGNTEISLLIINREYYPHPNSDYIPYLGITGEAKICTYLDNPKTAWIHQQLLLKYDPDLSQKWIKDLYRKIELKPEDDWLIEITPTKYYTD